MFSLTTLAACREPDDSATSNAAPRAEITSPADGAAGMAGAALSLRGTVSDDNDDDEDVEDDDKANPPSP